MYCDPSAGNVPCLCVLVLFCKCARRLIKWPVAFPLSDAPSRAVAETTSLTTLFCNVCTFCPSFCRLHDPGLCRGKKKRTASRLFRWLLMVLHIHECSYDTEYHLSIVTIKNDNAPRLSLQHSESLLAAKKSIKRTDNIYKTLQTGFLCRWTVAAAAADSYH